MTIKPGILLLIIAALFLEGTLVSLPLVFIFSLGLYILYPEEITLIFVFLAGAALDVMRFSTIGITPFVMVVCFIIINFYKRGFELNDYRVILFMLFVSSLIYASIFDYSTEIIVYFAIFGGFALIFSYFTKSELIK